MMLNMLKQSYMRETVNVQCDKCRCTASATSSLRGYGESEEAIDEAMTILRKQGWSFDIGAYICPKCKVRE